MKRIDFFGCCGVGKTTLYKSLEGYAPRDWQTYNQAVFDAAETLYRRLKLVNVLLPARVRLFLCQRVLDREVERKIWPHVKERYSEFLRLCLELASLSNQDELMIYKTLQLLYTDVFRVMIAGEKARAEKIVFFDESLPNKAFLIVGDNCAHAEQFYLNMPLPQGIVHVYADKEIIFERVRERAKRGHIALSHLNLNEEQVMHRIESEQAVCQTGVSVLRGRGVPILELNAGWPADQSINAFRNFLQTKFLISSA